MCLSTLPSWWKTNLRSVNVEQIRILGVPSYLMSAAYAVILHREIRAHVRFEFQMNTAAGPFLFRTRNMLWLFSSLQIHEVTHTQTYTHAHTDTHTKCLLLFLW